MSAVAVFFSVVFVFIYVATDAALKDSPKKSPLFGIGNSKNRTILLSGVRSVDACVLYVRHMLFY